MIGEGTLVESYEIVRPLGGGGMGEVFLARDVRLGREVAIKFLRAELTATPLQRRRFEREARAASALNHPNLVTIFEIGEYEGRPWFAMELIGGTRLRDVITLGALPVERALAIAAALSDGLAAAHARGIVHRDLKPENIMITDEGRVKILDFGLAKPTASGVDSIDPEAETLPGVVLGTAGYMAPEQARGLTSDFRSDQFSLGAILYELFSGRPAFRRASSAETLAAILHEEPPPLTKVAPETPPEVENVVRRCLRKEPMQRYASTSDLARDLRELADDARTPSRSGSGSQRSSIRTSPLKRPATLLAVPAIVLVTIVLATSRMTDTRQAEAAVPPSKYLVVAPFDAFGGSDELRLLAQGMAESISAQLYGARNLSVIPTSAIPEDKRNAGIAAIARATGANLVLKASLQTSNEMLRASFSILDPRGISVGAGVVEGPSAEPFVVQDRLSDAVTSTLLEESAAPRRGAGDALSPPDQDRYYRALGELQRYDDESAVDRAVSLLEPLAQTYPRSALVAAALGSAYFSKQTLTGDASWGERGVDASRRAAELNPNLFEVRLALGRAHLASGRLLESIAALEEALRLRPRDADAHNVLGRALLRTGDHARAEKEFRLAVEGRPSWWATHHGLGAFLLSVGRPQDSLESLREALRLSPGNSRVLQNLSVAYMHLGDYTKAAEVLGEAVEIAPTYQLWSNLGTCRYHVRQFAGAKEAFEEAVDLAPDSHLAWFNLAECARWANDAPRAREAYQKAVSLALEAAGLDPKDSRIHNRLALAYAHLGEEARSRRHLSRAFELSPENPDTLFVASILATQQKRADEAVALLERALAAGLPPFQIASDPELDPLRSDPKFQRLTGAQPAQAIAASP